jgi:FKBP-type peptidyl-prolyl cis-trans isomerase FklB
MKTIKFLSIVLVAIVLSSCNKQGVTNKQLKTSLDSVSYAIGLDMAYKIKVGFEDADVDLFVQGLRNGMDSTNILIAKDSLNIVIQQYFKNKQVEDRKKQQEEALKKAEETYNDNKVSGENFLEENKSKEGVIITETGLQYIVLKEGTGEKPLVTSRVKVHYHGTLTDGTVFDSSVDKGTPYTTYVNQVVKGWIEGLQLMSVGSKYKFFIPQELGYGATPRQGGVIKPFDVLVFDIELLEIVKK